MAVFLIGENNANRHFNKLCGDIYIVTILQESHFTSIKNSENLVAMYVEQSEIYTD